jgi:hypothetical protein
MHVLLVIVKVIVYLIIGLFVAEFITRWLMFKRFPFKIPKFNRKHSKQVVTPIKEETPVNTSLITSISVLILRDFITCCVDGNLSVLGIGTPNEQQAAFTSILSQYYEAKNDPSMSSYIKIIREIKAMELHRGLVNALCTVMRERYSYEAAKVMRELYPKYLFSKQNYIADMEMVAKSEIKNNIKYDRLVVQLKKHEQSQVSSEKVTNEQKHRNFITDLMDINKIEGVKYDINTMTVLEYAIAQGRKHDYIENLKEQANGSR